MIRITWNNLTPPGYRQKDVVKYIIKPAVLDNPELFDSIHQSAFYNKIDKALCHSVTRSRFFSANKDSVSVYNRMIALLLLNTKCENIPYNMDSFPIRREFKKRWKCILTPYEELSRDEQKEISKNGKGYYVARDGCAEDGRRVLASPEVDVFKKYIRKLLGNSGIPESLVNLEGEMGKSSSANRACRDFQEISASFTYSGHEVCLDKLLEAMQDCGYSSSSYNEGSISLSREDNLLLEQIATISVLASVWYIFEQAGDEGDAGSIVYREQIMRLFAMIFPREAMRQLQPEGQDGPETAFIIGNLDTEKAEEDIGLIKAHMNAGRYTEAGELCEKVFAVYRNASDRCISNALISLIECCEHGYPKPGYFSSIDDIKKEAVNAGCIYLSDKRHEIKVSGSRPLTSVKGTFTLNCGNSICDWIKETSPANWDYVISVMPELTLAAGTSQRIILINDDFEINMQDALNVLDEIKKRISEGGASISGWQNLEVFIRCNEEEITPLLDTALSYFTEDSGIQSDNDFPLIRIYLIDEAKRSAGYLFARHPNFYPLTFARNAGEGSKTIHLAIVSDNSDLRYAKWLIKEGFWTLPRSDRSIRTRITVISPYAEELCHSIGAECPGLTALSFLDGKKVPDPCKIDIDDISFPEIAYISTSFSNRALWVELDKVCASNDYLYFVVDSASDSAGMNLGIKIRELAIRKAVNSGRIKSYSKKNYTIAVRCINPDYAGLIQDLIIPKEEEHGNQWFNDYNFITFGSTKDLYSWSQLDGGVLETMSQCIHLQYSSSGFSKPECRKHLASYFRRLYNRDSSFAAAVSLPYRLFEAGIVPKAWFIQNSDAWWSENVRKELAEEYEKRLFPSSPGGSFPTPGGVDQELRNRLARYEHTRWCCYQLTRGWLPVDGNNVIQYIHAGVTKHALQIARLHPCICSWEQLERLQRVLDFECTRKVPLIAEDCPSDKEQLLDKKFKKYLAFENDFTYFQKIDYTNIEQTPDILNASWHPDRIFLPDGRDR